ncbi:MAG TPA: outer membrane beta-barrel protein [Vicinamibacterales bacterium]|nr:outer membrane beta-barrel protein [Vicinamibacterales bacterium]
MKKAVWSSAVVLFLLPAAAHAQVLDSSSIDEARQNARTHAGPFYIDPTVLLKELGVDSNVFNAATDEKSDFTFTVAPQANVAVAMAHRALITTTAAADLVWYAHYASERSVNPQVTVREETYLHRITLFAQEAYLNTRQRPNFEIDLRSQHLENDALGGVQYRVTPKIFVEVAGRREDTRYNADAFFDGTSLEKTLNRKTTGGEATVRYARTPLTTIGVKYERLSDQFAFSPERNSSSYRVMPGLEFKPKALVSGFAWVGYRKFTPDRPEVLPAFGGLVADLGLSYTLLGATSFGVSYRRDLTYSYELYQPFFVNNEVGASVRRALGSRFDVLVSADRHRYVYQNLLALPSGVSPLDQRVDTIWNYAGSVGYRVGHDGRIGLGVSYYERDSGLLPHDYDGLRVGTVLNYGF